MDDLERDSALIRALVEHAGTTPAGVAKRANVAVTTVNRPFNGTAPSRLGRSALEKLRHAFPEFPGWSDYLGQALSAADPDMVEVDQIDLRYGLGATYVDGPVESEKRVFSRSWLSQFTRAAPEQLFWALAEGGSMANTIMSGETVLIDRSQTIPRVSGGVWALTIGDLGMIKRLHVPGRGRIQWLSDSGLEPPIEPSEDDEQKIIGRVIAVVRRL